MAYARHFRAMGKREADGRTVREHLTFALEKARTPEKRARIASDLAGPPMPRGYAPVFDLFMQVARWRASGPMGASGLTLHDIAAWEARFLPAGVHCTAEELDLLKRLDTVMLSEA